MDVLIAGFVVALISSFSGGFAIPTGFALGLSALEVYVAACLGSFAGLTVFLYAGDKVRQRLAGGRATVEMSEKSALRTVLEKHGAKGLGLVGPVFPGVTASVLIGLSLGMTRASLARWMSAGIALLFGAYTVAMWALVELAGVG